jgi:hypothetical protein
MGMANRTIAQQIAILEARRDTLESAITTGSGGISSSSIDGMSITRASIDVMSKELTKVEKSLQRLYRGGRGFQIDLSSCTASNDSTDINETYTTRTV